MRDPTPPDKNGPPPRGILRSAAENPELLRRFFDGGPVGMAMIARDFTHIEVNATLCLQMGYSREEMLRLTVMDVVDPEYLHDTLEGYRKLLTGEIAVHKTEKRYTRKTGEHWWGASIISVINDTAGNFLCFFVMVEDITDRKIAEQAFREAQASYERLFASMRDAFASIDLAGKIVEYNEPFRLMIGYEPGEIDALTYEDITPAGWHSLEKEILDSQVMTRGWSDVYEKEFRKKDGTVFPVELRTCLLRDSGGKPTGMLAIIRDNTERKRAEALLEQSEQRMRALIQNAPFGAHEYELADDGRLLFCGYNPAADRILGVDHAPFIGKPIEEAFPALRETPIPAAYRRVAQTGTRYEKEQVIYSAGGIAGVFEVSAFQTAPNRMASFFRDVTERKHEEEQRKKSELLFKSLIESSPSGVIVNKEDVAVYVNPAAAKIFKSSPEHMTGRRIWEHIPSENRETVQKRIEQVMSGLPAPPYESRIDAGDGTQVDIETSGIPILFEGTPAIMSFFNDITARKKAEERQKHLESVLWTIRSVNQMILKARKSEEVLNRSCELFVKIRDFSSACIVPADDRETVAFKKNPADRREPVQETECMRNARELLSGKKKVRLLSVTAREGSGEKSEFSEQSICLRMEYGGHTYGVLIVTLPRIFAEDPEEQSILLEVADDIAFTLYKLDLEASRKHAQKELKRYAREMECSNRQLLEMNRELDAANAHLKVLDELKSEFVALASHELRTPLTSILGYTQTLLAGRAVSDESCRLRFLRVIESESKRLARLIGDLLDLSRIEKGSLPFSFEPIDLLAVLNGTKDAMNWPADRPLDIRNELPPAVRGRADPVRLGQALRNILENALRACGESGRITVTVSRVGEFVLVAITDTGPGIRAADQVKIFEKFYKIRDEKRASSGSGLGLPLARDIVQAHGGRLWVESQAGHGSTFFLTIPVFHEDAGASPVDTAHPG